MKVKLIVWGVIIAAIVIVVVWAVRWFGAEPVISVDYLAKMNELRKPADYHPDEDGIDEYTAAWKLMDDDVKFPKLPGLKETRYWSHTPGIMLWPGDVNESDRAAIKAWFAANDEAFQLAEKAIAKKYCWFRLYSRNGRLDSVIVWDAEGAVNLCGGLIWRAKIKAYEGDTKGAFDDLAKATRLAGFSSEKPGMMEWFRRMGIARQCAHVTLLMASRCQVRSEELAQAASQMEKTYRQYHPVDPVVDEYRVHIGDAVQRLFSDDGHGDGHLIPAALVDDGWFRYDRLEYRTPKTFEDHLKLWADAIRTSVSNEGRKATLARWDAVMAKQKAFLAMEPWEAKQQGTSLADIQNEANKNDFVRMGSRWFLDTSVKAARAYDADVHGTIATIAVFRYKADSNTLPADWQEVVDAGYLAEPPRDIYTGKPLIYKAGSEGFTVYSLGEDCTDDGGDPKKDVVTWPLVPPAAAE